MQFLKSILFGCEGSYNIFGIPVTFQNTLPSYLTPPSLDGAGLVSQLALKCINSNAFRWITQGYTHVFVHEISHALTYKLLIGSSPKVNFFTNLCIGKNQFPATFSKTPGWKKTVVSVAGPMGNIAFSTCKLVAAVALKNYLSWPVALAVGSGAIVWIAGELLYAYVSGVKEDNGDFGDIAGQGRMHLALASAALILQSALGIFAALKIDGITR